MLKRSALSTLGDDLAHYPAVALLGPRQAGKTTVAHQLALGYRSVYLDL